MDQCSCLTCVDETAAQLDVLAASWPATLCWPTGRVAAVLGLPALLLRVAASLLLCAAAAALSSSRCNGRVAAGVLLPALLLRIAAHLLWGIALLLLLLLLVAGIVIRRLRCIRIAALHGRA